MVGIWSKILLAPGEQESYLAFSAVSDWERGSQRSDWELESEGDLEDRVTAVSASERVPARHLAMRFLVYFLRLKPM